MAFLSLGLNIDEPQLANGASPNAAEDATDEKSRAEERPQLSSNHANGNGASPKNPAQQKADQEISNDNWSDTGLQIIQSVLREAEKKTASSSNASENERHPTPDPSNGHSPVEQLPELPDLEELRKIAEGIATSPTAESNNHKEDVGARSVLARSTVDDASGSAAAAQPAPEAPAKTESAQALELESAKQQTATAKSEVSTPAPAPQTTEAERQFVSSLAPEFLSPVMEELRKKLAGAGEVSNKDRGETAVLARLGSNSSRQVSAPPQIQRDPIPSFATFKFGELPGRGLLYSFIGHEVAMFAMFLLITYIIPNIREQRLIVGSLNPQDHIVYLPDVGGGTEGAKSAGGGESKPLQASAAPARASKGFAYPGAQPILSNPPNPTNAFQTVLHPLAVRPEPLKKLVPLPNIVQMAETRLPSDLVATKVAMPHYQAPVQPIKVRQDNILRRNAKFDVPVKAPQLIAKADMPKLAAAEQPLPVAPKVEPKPVPPKAEAKPAPAPIKVRAEKEKQADKSEKEAAPPSAAQVARLQMHGKSSEPLLSLSPAPLPTMAKVPAGEARGRFALAPGGKLNPNAVAPGKPSGTQSESPATGQETSKSANATSELASNAGTGTGHNPAAGGGTGKSTEASGGGSLGAGSGSGNTVGAGTAAVGTGNGHGSAGAGAGRSGRGSGTGSGAGSGAGNGSFPGITIQGGEGNEGANDAHSFSVAQQTPYQMTIVATASSGGGLADYGVFENERVYTVYVPMQRTPQEADPTWTLQYALEDSKSDSGGQLIAPTPVMREWPQIPADLEKAYSQQQVVVAAILGTDGKLTHLSVKQSPDPHVSVPITQALAKWVFRPAQLDNKPVAVKILLGIPL
ncbi:MAG TPA: hypothetical protein VJO35_09510 [Terriglobales bacterium]|nr:hypothetical protein [Terriglobales bacterium]